MNMEPNDRSQALEENEFVKTELSQPIPSSTLPTLEELQREGERHSRHLKDGEISKVEETHELSPDANPTGDSSIACRYTTSSSEASTQSPNLDNPFALFDTVERLTESRP
ncbi:hypothetical protein GJ744_008588 [Endocarpon pusillum]|uniref:Uncharacterized protein n=1 Tax=Endocarpon pusillum TaxID=364733 RepID=A0A8H7AK46_9EURO|nr:hypothetical protein GJ744_008588 [Endocarpon pusillum]